MRREGPSPFPGSHSQGLSISRRHRDLHRNLWGFLKKYNWIYLFILAVLGLCCMGFSLVAASRGHSRAGATLELGWEGFSPPRLLLRWSTGLGTSASVVVAHGLSCSVAHGILLEQGSILCLLYRWADSLPLSCPGSPCALPGLSCASESQMCPEVLVVQSLSRVHLFVTPWTEVLLLCFTPFQLGREFIHVLCFWIAGETHTYRHARLNTTGVTLHVLFPETCFCLSHVTHISTNEFPMVFHTVSEACTGSHARKSGHRHQPRPRPGSASRLFCCPPSTVSWTLFHTSKRRPFSFSFVVFEPNTRGLPHGQMGRLLSTLGCFFFFLQIKGQ